MMINIQNSDYSIKLVNSMNEILFCLYESLFAIYFAEMAVIPVWGSNMQPTLRQGKVMVTYALESLNPNQYLTCPSLEWRVEVKSRGNFNFKYLLGR